MSCLAGPANGGHNFSRGAGAMARSPHVRINGCSPPCKPNMKISCVSAFFPPSRVADSLRGGGCLSVCATNRCNLLGAKGFFAEDSLRATFGHAHPELGGPPVVDGRSRQGVCKTRTCHASHFVWASPCISPNAMSVSVTIPSVFHVEHGACNESWRVCVGGWIGRTLAPRILEGISPDMPASAIW